MPRIFDKSTTDTITDSEVVPFDGAGGLKARTWERVKNATGQRVMLAVTNEAELAAVTTEGMGPLPMLIFTGITDNARIWILRPEVGSESSDYSGGLKKPDDYDGDDNAVIFESYA